MQGCLGCFGVVVILAIGGYVLENFGEMWTGIYFGVIILLGIAGVLLSVVQRSKEEDKERKKQALDEHIQLVRDLIKEKSIETLDDKDREIVGQILNKRIEQGHENVLGSLSTKVREAAADLKDKIRTTGLEILLNNVDDILLQVESIIEIHSEQKGKFGDFLEQDGLRFSTVALLFEKVDLQLKKRSDLIRRLLSTLEQMDEKVDSIIQTQDEYLVKSELDGHEIDRNTVLMDQVKGEIAEISEQMADLTAVIKEIYSE